MSQQFAANLTHHSGLVLAVALSTALTFYRGFKISVHEIGVYSQHGSGIIQFKKLSESELAKRPEQAVILKLEGIMSFVNFEGIVKKLKRKIGNTRPMEVIYCSLAELN